MNKSVKIIKTIAIIIFFLALIYFFFLKARGSNIPKNLMGREISPLNDVVTKIIIQGS